MPGLSRETRLQIMLDEDELAAVDDWRFKQRMPSRAAAVRWLLNIGLKAKMNGPVERSIRSKDFGLLGEGKDSKD